MSILTDIRAIVLKRTKFGESDLIVQMLLSSGAKKSFLARGALKSKKRFAGGALEPTTYLKIQYRDKGDEKLAILEDVQIIDSFALLRTDYDRMEMALDLVRIIYTVAQEGDQASESLFNLLGHGLRILQTADDIEKLKIVFVMKLFFQQGVLEIEDWMRIGLASPLASWADISNKIQFTQQQRSWMQLKLREYLESAGVSN